MTSYQKKWAVSSSATIAVIMLATNPEHAAHLGAIKKTCDFMPETQYSLPVTLWGTRMSDAPTLLTYNNFLLFSTTTISVGPDPGVVSWGCFGRVHTTNRVYVPPRT